MGVSIAGKLFCPGSRQALLETNEVNKVNMHMSSPPHRVWLRLDCGAHAIGATVRLPRVQACSIEPTTYHHAPVQLFRAAALTRIMGNILGAHAKASINWSLHRAIFGSADGSQGTCANHGHGSLYPTSCVPRA